ncbi:NXPE family member 3-like [Saccoglossus kowalevskii]
MSVSTSKTSRLRLPSQKPGVRLEMSYVYLERMYMVCIGLVLGYLISQKEIAKLSAPLAFRDTSVMNICVHNFSTVTSETNVKMQGVKPDAHKPKTRQNEQLFPYLMYDRFAMEWVNIVDELEWIHENSYDETDKVKRLPFDIGIGVLGPTSVNTTRVKIQNDKQDIRKGNYVCVIIETFDENGRKRNRGGDFFTANMKNEELEKSTAGRIIDHGNGTYSVYFYAAWSGAAEINIALSFTREAINYIKDTLKTKEELVGFSANYTDGRRIEEARCSLINEGAWKHRCEYTNKISLGKTVFACQKPEHYNCDQISSVKAGVAGLNRVALAETKTVEYLYDGRYSTVNLRGTPVHLHILDATTPSLDLPPCGPDLPKPLSDGYWDNKYTYVSLTCQSIQWEQDEFEKCINDKEFLLSGDSTLKQVSESFSNFNFKNTNFNFMIPRLAGPKIGIWEGRFESDLIDNINKQQCQTKTQVLILNFCFHYALWSMRSYVERLVLAKKSIERLIQRCPKSKIMIQLSHARDNLYKEQNIHSNNWIFYDMNRIIRRVFGGMGIMFLDVWDLINSSFEENNVHMPRYIILQELHLALSYLCTERRDMS